MAHWQQMQDNIGQMILYISAYSHPEVSSIFKAAKHESVGVTMKTLQENWLQTLKNIRLGAFISMINVK